MHSLSPLFFVVICLIAFVKCFPTIFDPLALSDDADQPTSVEGYDIAAYTGSCSGEGGAVTQKRSDSPGACKNPATSHEKKPHSAPPAEQESDSTNQEDPGPTPQGPFRRVKPANKRVRCADNNYRPLCGRGIPSDSDRGGLQVKHVYLLNPGIPCQAIWCCLHYWPNLRLGKTCDRDGAVIVNFDPTLSPYSEASNAGQDSDYEVSEAGEENPGRDLDASA